MITVAAIQTSACSNVGNNLVAVELMVKKSAACGAKLVVLPDYFACIPRDAKDILLIKESLGQGRIQSFLANLARDHAIWLVCGSIPITTADEERVHHTCFVYNSNGEQVAHYHKKHLFDAYLGDLEHHEESRYVIAGAAAEVIQTPAGTIGIVAGHDLRYPSHFNALRSKGAEIFVITGQFPEILGNTHWRALLTARAIDYQAYIIAANQYGQHENAWQSYGHSMIIGPWGKVLDIRPEGHGVLLSTLDQERLHFLRQEFPL